MNDLIFAAPTSNVTLQINTVPMTLNAIQTPTPVREWSFLNAFQPRSGELSSVLGKKSDYARIVKVRPPALVIDSRTADVEENLAKTEGVIQKSCAPHAVILLDLLTASFNLDRIIDPSQAIVPNAQQIRSALKIVNDERGLKHQRIACPTT